MKVIYITFLCQIEAYYAILSMHTHTVVCPNYLLLVVLASTFLTTPGNNCLKLCSSRCHAMRQSIWIFCQVSSTVRFFFWGSGSETTWEGPFNFKSAFPVPFSDSQQWSFIESA